MIDMPLYMPNVRRLYGNLVKDILKVSFVVVVEFSFFGRDVEELFCHIIDAS